MAVRRLGVLLAVIVLQTCATATQGSRLALDLQDSSTTASTTWSSSSSTSSLPFTDSSTSTSSLPFTTSLPDTTTLQDTTTTWTDTTETPVDTTTTWTDTTSATTTTWTDTTVATEADNLRSDAGHRWPTPNGEDCYCNPIGGAVCGLNGIAFDNACIPSCARIPFVPRPCADAGGTTSTSTTTTATELETTTPTPTRAANSVKDEPVLLSWFAQPSTRSIELRFSLPVDFSTLDLSKMQFFNSAAPDVTVQLVGAAQHVVSESTIDMTKVLVSLTTTSWNVFVSSDPTHVMLEQGAITSSLGVASVRLVAGIESAPQNLDGVEEAEATTEEPSSPQGASAQISTNILIVVVLAVCVLLIAVSGVVYFKQRQLQKEYNAHLLDRSETASSFLHTEPTPVPRRRQDGDELEWDNLLRYNGQSGQHDSWYSEHESVFSGYETTYGGAPASPDTPAPRDVHRASLATEMLFS